MSDLVDLLIQHLSTYSSTSSVSSTPFAFSQSEMSLSSPKFYDDLECLASEDQWPSSPSSPSSSSSPSSPSSPLSSLPPLSSSSPLSSSPPLSPVQRRSARKRHNRFPSVFPLTKKITKKITKKGQPKTVQEKAVQKNLQLSPDDINPVYKHSDCKFDNNPETNNVGFRYLDEGDNSQPFLHVLRLDAIKTPNQPVPHFRVVHEVGEIIMPTWFNLTTVTYDGNPIQVKVNMI